MTKWNVMRAALVLMACGAALLGARVVAQDADVLYDEARVPGYTLPDLLVMKSGERVRDAKTWTSRRREEILELYRSEVFGRSPAKPSGLKFAVDSVDWHSLNGRAVRKQVTIAFVPADDAPRMHMLMHLPAAAKRPVPLILALAFASHQKTDPATAPQWQLDQILAHGYGLATIFYGDIELDVVDGIGSGVRPLFFKPGQSAPEPGDWGAIGAWAWGLSRAMDYLETDRDVDATRVAVMGHSRLGKTALWAGAQDTRFSIVISNESGEGGAAISRRLYGERTKNLNDRFPHWFAGNFRKYNGREEEMPVDAHMLLALIAPRPLYVASAEEDRWADPRGEFLAAAGAEPVYRLFGRRGIGGAAMPGVHQPVGETVRYHVRAGKHDVTAYDWEQYLSFAARHWPPK